MDSKYGFLTEQEFDEPLTDSYAVRMHFLYSWEDAREFLFENYKDALTILEEDTSNILEEMEKWDLRYADKVWKYTEDWKYEFMDTYWEIIEKTELEDWKFYIIADIHLDILNQYGIDVFSIENFTKNLIDSINKSKDVDFLRIFRDDWQLIHYKTIYEQIYKLEMRLREIISEIFLKKYYPEIDNFLKDLKIGDQKFYKRFWKNENWWDIKIQNLREKNENLFFYLLFSDYEQLLELKNLDNYELTRILESAKTFKQRKDKIFDRWITDEADKFFLESIKDDLEKIEIVRNAIMHCRNLTEEELRNYSISRKNLLRLYNFFEYWEDDLGLVVWEYYEVKMNVWDFEIWKKYKLKYRDWHDAIFILENWEEVHFMDKEVMEYFKVYPGL